MPGKIRKYVCVNCGTPANDLYKEYATGVLKICHCESCANVIDPYIETDISNILIDTALQRVTAYRHLLWNRTPMAAWKFGLICLLCDAYQKWATHRLHTGKPQSYFELEWVFYVMCLKSAVENFAFFLIMGLVLYLLKHQRRIPRKSTPVHIRRVLSNLVTVAGCCKMFTVPAILWSWNVDEYTYSSVLITIFVHVSLIQACKAVVNRSWICVSVVTLAFGLQLGTKHLLELHMGSGTELFKSWIFEA